jgi:hypothetical protein
MASRMVESGIHVALIKITASSWFKNGATYKPCK